MVVTRRAVLGAAALALGGLVARPPLLRAEGKILEVLMRSDESGAHVWFEPNGLLVEPGQTVRWVVQSNVHTTTAYAPQNGDHSLRIPEGAAPWNSGFLVNPGDHFDVTFRVEGVYDYFCLPHEESGMVGRLVVGQPGGPGTLPFDYFKGRPGTEKWKAVPPAARKAFPPVEDIVARTRVTRRV